MTVVAEETKDAIVADYMARDVISVEPQMTVKEVTEKVIESDFDGFPISERGYLLGFVTSKELLKFTERPDATMREVMKRAIYIAPSMKISDAARFLFRYGLRDMPVVDENKKLVGIISNVDIIRSQIEKGERSKIMAAKETLEICNGIKIKIVDTMDVPITHLLPSQKKIYMDEFIGRQYEIKKGLYEPMIVVERRRGYLIVDGHHRALAAAKLGLRKFKVVILKPADLDVTLGLERTAKKLGLHTLNDVEIIEGSRSPFIKVAFMLLPEEETESIKKRLEGSK